jgi:hypothetical protein
MKPVPLFALATALGLSGSAPPAFAQSNYPWCLISTAFEGGENCGFVTFDQCLASRLGIGGFCQINTQYQPSVSAGPRRAQKAP